MKELLKSIRSILAFMIGVTFCILAIRGEIDKQAFGLIVSQVIAFYFLSKKRSDER